MIDLENDEGRPLPGPASNVIADASLHSVAADEDRPRCRACHHVVWSEASVASGYGRDCRRAIARQRREAAA